MAAPFPNSASMTLGPSCRHPIAPIPTSDPTYHLLIFVFSSPFFVLASVTVHSHDSSPTQTGSGETYSGVQAYNPTTLPVPPLPTPAPPKSFSLQLSNNPDPSLNLSIPQSGSFFGFSIEATAASRIIGKNGTVLQVPFLNLISNVQHRAGSVNIRIGGASVDNSRLVDSLGAQVQAILYGAADPPPLVYSTGFLYMLSNVSSLLNVNWYLGIPFKDTQNFHLGLAAYGQSILGDNLVGLQVGEQPDRYASSALRPYNYTPNDYNAEFGRLAAALQNGSTSIGEPVSNPVSIAVASNNGNDRLSKLLIGPNIISGEWTPEQVWYSGFLDDQKENLAALAVEYYPFGNINCVARTGSGPNISAETLFPYILNHTGATTSVKPYLNSARIAQQVGKPLLMIETNTAECGGIPGLSDSFGASLWALDYALQMAYANFSGAMFHTAGQNSSFNAFLPAPNAQGSTLGWTIGSIYYSSLVMAEMLGPSGKSRVLDLGIANNISMFTPAYAIYDDDSGAVTRIGLFNYISDSSGGSNLEVDIGMGDATPSTVSVKYLLASSVSQKANITWAGQTFGGYFDSTGIPYGSEDIQTVSCANQSCKISVPAPGFALVFLTADALAQAEGQPSGSSSLTAMVADASNANNVGGAKTFGTTVVTLESLGVTVDPSALATSNGERGGLGGTSQGKGIASGTVRKGYSKIMGPILTLTGLVIGCGLVL